LVLHSRLKHQNSDQKSQVKSLALEVYEKSQATSASAPAFVLVLGDQRRFSSQFRQLSLGDKDHILLDLQYLSSLFQQINKASLKCKEKQKILNLIFIPL